MNKQNAEKLITALYALENHKSYQGFKKCLKMLAETDRTLAKMMKNEGLIHE